MPLSEGVLRPQPDPRRPRPADRDWKITIRHGGHTVTVAPHRCDVCGRMVDSLAPGVGERGFRHVQCTPDGRRALVASGRGVLDADELEELEPAMRWARWRLHEIQLRNLQFQRRRAGARR